jgi:hypothetical protein
MIFESRSSPVSAIGRLPPPDLKQYGEAARGVPAYSEEARRGQALGLPGDCPSLPPSTATVWRVRSSWRWPATRIASQNAQFGCPEVK